MLVGYGFIGMVFKYTADFYSEIIENITIGEQETSVFCYQVSFFEIAAYLTVANAFPSILSSSIIFSGEQF